MQLSYFFFFYLSFSLSFILSISLFYSFSHFCFYVSFFLSCFSVSFQDSLIIYFLIATPLSNYFFVFLSLSFFLSLFLLIPLYLSRLSISFSLCLSCFYASFSMTLTCFWSRKWDQVSGPHPAVDIFFLSDNFLLFLFLCRQKADDIFTPFTIYYPNTTQLCAYRRQTSLTTLLSCVPLSTFCSVRFLSSIKHKN